ncbi:PDZ and LIM domain protein 7-like isoform X2 [Anopheles bellator]|uniref:PDZ and LIM domain protein 7-like isoform X2 n=2 Tax=Anopheles bellator TaxID=139047 RepID=UPI0026484720|nr:PDZ and LIM domain protein 7-like isoform X2 [Anopheles bellator]
MPEFVIEKRNIPVLTVSSRDGTVGTGPENGENPLGFRITGGADFEMPVTVFQVSEGSPAQKAGLQLGDQVLKINGADASAMRLATAQSVIKQAGEQLQMIVAKDNEENRKAEEQGKPKETTEVKFIGNEQEPEADVTNKPAPKPKTDDRENWTQPPERKVWHPIVWQQPPPPIPPDLYGKDAPHQQLIANIRRLLTETRSKPQEQLRHIERMMLSLPTGSRREEDEEEEPKPVPKPKKKKKAKTARKGATAPRPRLDSEGSEDGSVSEASSAIAHPAEPIPEEVTADA